MNIIRWITDKGSDRTAKSMLFILWGIFLLSRIAYYTAGVRYAGNWIIDDCMSIVPYDLMQTDLLSSVWHFHAQPPLFSLFCGIAVKLFGGWESEIINVIYLVIGVGFVSILYLFMHSFGVPYRLACLMVGLFCISPDAVLYENIILYTYPVAALLLASCYFLFVYIRTGERKWGALTFALWGALVLTRSMFHLVWFATGIMIVIGVAPRRWKQIVMLAVIPFLLTTGWYAKNYVQFGFFGSSSWIGMSLSKIALNSIDNEEKMSLAQQGAVSELVFLRPFPGYWQLGGNVDIPKADSTGVTILDYQFTDSGFSNYNNLVYISLNKQFLKDSVSIIKHYPGKYLSRGLVKSFSLFFAPANTWFNIWRQERDYEQNFYRIEPFAYIWNAVVAGDFSTDNNTIGWFTLFMYLSVMVYWPYRLIRDIPIFHKKKAWYAVTVFMLMTIVYITLISNLLELGENMRFRFNIDPFALILFGLMLSHILSYLAQKIPQHTSPAKERIKPKKKRS